MSSADRFLDVLDAELDRDYGFSRPHHYKDTYELASLVNDHKGFIRVKKEKKDEMLFQGMTVAVILSGVFYGELAGEMGRDEWLVVPFTVKDGKPLSKAPVWVVGYMSSKDFKIWYPSRDFPD